MKAGAAIFLGVALVAAVALSAAVAAQDSGAGHVKTSTKAAQARLKTLLAHLQHRYQETNSFKARFKETVIRAGGMKQEREGSIYYRRPGRIRWDFAQPQPETVVSDGSLIYDYDPGLNQVVETPLKQAFRTQGAAAFLLGVGNVERDFVASAPASEPHDGRIHLTLTPKAGGSAAELGLDPKSFNILSLRLADALGDVTEVNFADTQANLPLDPSLFTFQVPDGVDVVRVSPRG